MNSSIRLTISYIIEKNTDDLEDITIVGES